jgi:putative phosphoesterase
MRILVVSDTHRDSYSFRQAILQQPKAEVVIHLGDGADEAQEMKESFPEKMFLMVRGNCDWGSALPNVGDFQADGKHIFYTHGHIFNVKYGMYNIISEARARKANILLFGHTHNAFTDYEDGLYIMNPGSLSGAGGTYGIIDITKAGIVTNIIKKHD